MWKKNKWKIVLTALVTLAPIVVGLVLWNRLPDRIPIHWGVNNQPDNWAGKAVAVFGMPALLLVLHLVCLFAVHADPKRKNISGVMRNIVFWIVPLVSWVVIGMMYAAALGTRTNIALVALLAVGVLLVVMGNYLPKSQPNYTVGIRTPWALEDPDNWQKTHRLGGRLAIVAGLVTIGTAFVPKAPVSLVIWLVVLIIAIAAPCVYSYSLYRKKNKS